MSRWTGALFDLRGFAPLRTSSDNATDRTLGSGRYAQQTGPDGASAFSPWLHRFAILTAISTFGLIIIGGLVTSHGAGMAVPDWPNTYGYNMFAFPFSKWVGGILYEHSHRLIATFVGLLTAVLALWLWLRETRGKGRWLGVGAIVMVLGLMGIRALPIYITLACLALLVGAFSLYQIKNNFAALRWWGALAFAAVILQGVLGGLRVVWRRCFSR